MPLYMSDPIASFETDLVLEKVSYFAMIFYTIISITNSQTQTQSSSDPVLDFDLSQLHNSDSEFSGEEVASYIAECQSVGAFEGYNILYNSTCVSLQLQSDNQKSLSQPTLPSISIEEGEHALMHTKSFIKAMISDFSVCPFTRGVEKAGVPQGLIRYTISYATTVNEAFFDYWSEVYMMLSSPISDASTVILVFANPYFLGNFDDFQSLTDILDRGLDDDTSTSSYPSFKLGKLINNVYFHPQYQFIDRDEQIMVIFDDITGEVIGTSKDLISPISYARRSPFPFINILRSDMVKSSQSGIPEGKIFNLNKLRLESVGSNVLQNMLDNLDWSDLPSPLSIKLN